MEVIQSPQAMRDWCRNRKSSGKTIALVPTMGYFHQGHLSLMRMAKEHADHVVVSLFVNPIQFGPNEDFSSYPRDLERDKAMAEAEGVDVLFAPEPGDMYPRESFTRISVERLSRTLCGRNRPGHFEGVCTVVAKLFHIVLPDTAVFGRKDFQQLAVIRRMVQDLSWDISIVGHPVVREADGLAMSSRNTYLSERERRSALCLYKAIKLARKQVRKGVTGTSELVGQLTALIEGHENVAIEYIDVVDQESLALQDAIDSTSVLAMAVRIGRTRLIDNDALFEGD